MYGCSYADSKRNAWNELRSLQATTCIQLDGVNVKSPSTGGDYLPGGRYYASQDGEANGPRFSRGYSPG